MALTMKILLRAYLNRVLSAPRQRNVPTCLVYLLVHLVLDPIHPAQPVVEPLLRGRWIVWYVASLSLLWTVVVMSRGDNRLRS